MVSSGIGFSSLLLLSCKCYIFTRIELSLQILLIVEKIVSQRGCGRRKPAMSCSMVEFHW